ncbi:MAG: DUF1460 domain-containing protein [Bacteroidaceae bacterium]|nr:DUF1460 domain-containing protein [Bacteroidaceae bacterium]
MKRQLHTLLLALFPLIIAAQDIIYEKSDSARIEHIIQQHAALKYNDKGELTLAIAKEFIGSNYVANTLENGNREPLYISCSKFDCTTFVELVTAISMSITNGETAFNNVCHNLEKIRYREGKRKGYASRLHYMSWWIADNSKRRIVEEVTHNSAHKEYSLTLDFMSTHPDSYSMLTGSKRMQTTISELEKPFRGIKVQYIPKELLSSDKEALDIQNGDIIALVTSIKGLDVSHVGFAEWKEGKLHLVHASSSSGKVISDPVSLYRYQKEKSRQKGIRVIRIR